MCMYSVFLHSIDFEMKYQLQVANFNSASVSIHTFPLNALTTPSSVNNTIFVLIVLGKQ